MGLYLHTINHVIQFFFKVSSLGFVVDAPVLCFCPVICIFPATKLAIIKVSSFQMWPWSGRSFNKDFFSESTTQWKRLNSRRFSQFLTRQKPCLKIVRKMLKTTTLAGLWKDSCWYHFYHLLNSSKNGFSISHASIRPFEKFKIQAWAELGKA